MALQEDIQQLLVIGNDVVVTVSYNPGIEETGVVDEIADGEFKLRGEILNQYEHFSNISANPVYRMRTFNIADITSIKLA